MKTLQGFLKGIILVVQMHKIVLTLVAVPKGAALSYLLLILLYFFKKNNFPCCPIPWEPCNCFASSFYWCSWYYSKAYLTKGTFLQPLPLCWKAFWNILGLFLGTAYSWELFPILSYEILYILFLYYKTVSVLRKLSHPVTLCWESYVLFLDAFWLHSSMLWKI